MSSVERRGQKPLYSSENFPSRSQWLVAQACCGDLEQNFASVGPEGDASVVAALQRVSLLEQDADDIVLPLVPHLLCLSCGHTMA